MKLFERTGDGTDMDPNLLKAYIQQSTAEAQEGEKTPFLPFTVGQMGKQWVISSYFVSCV